MKKVFALVFITLAASGCTVMKTPAAMGGSKADASVTMGYSYTHFEKPVVNWDAASAEATKRCQAWGYKDAEPFGGIKTTCNAVNGYGNCMDTFVAKEYQCLGGEARFH